VDDVLATAAARLELRAWELRLHTASGDDPRVAAARELAATVRTEVEQLAASPGQAALRTRVGGDLAALSRAVEAAEQG
jgi:hypothetical protein